LTARREEKIRSLLPGYAFRTIHECKFVDDPDGTDRRFEPYEDSRCAYFGGRVKRIIIT
jgi:hypothetical protein